MAMFKRLAFLVTLFLAACSAVPASTAPNPASLPPLTLSPTSTSQPPTQTAPPTATHELTPTTTPVQIAAPLTASWWNSRVFYEVFVRSFADSTSGPLANDGIGDLQGLIEHLDYLNDGDTSTTTDLGVTGLWLMPIMQSPSYHGYDVTDYYTVNQDYGTNGDFQRLVSEAHQRGIKVIIDLPLNHTSSEHPWFVEARDDPQSTRRDWYIWSQDNPGYLGPWGEEVWHPSESGYYYGIFTAEMPDLNYRNPAVTAEMENVTRYWLKDMGVDGFRLDAARHLIEEGPIQESTQATHDWWKNFRPVYKAVNPEALTVGEIWTSDSEVVKYVQGDQLDLAFDFDLAEAIISGVKISTAGKLQEALKSSYSLFGSSRSAIFLTNHDMNRVMSQLHRDPIKAKLAAAVLLTIPGVPFIYYGEEIGMTGIKPDEMIRTPMQWSGDENAGFTSGTPWEAINSDYIDKNVAVQTEDPESLLSRYRDLIRIRAVHPALQVGDYHGVDAANKRLLAYLRVSKSEILLVIHNLGEATVSGYDLTLKEGPLSGSYRAIPVYGPQAEMPDLNANDQGGFDSYLPLPEIAAGGTIIIQLQTIR